MDKLQELKMAAVDSGLTLSKGQASKLVGGYGELNRLIAEGAIMVVPVGKGKKTYHHCDAEDVFNHVKLTGWGVTDGGEPVRDKGVRGRKREVQVREYRERKARYRMKFHEVKGGGLPPC